MKKTLLLLTSLFICLFSIAQPNGNSFSCNSGVGYITIPDNNYVDLQDSITIEMWVNSCDSNATSEFDLLTKGWCQPGDAAYYFYITGKKLHWQFAPVGGSCSNLSEVASSNQFLINPNTWYHIALSHSALGGVKMYVNGTLVPSSFVSGAPGQIRNSNEPLLMNVYKYFSGNLGLSLPGKIDEVRLWKKVRTAGEISSNMNVSLTGSEIGLAAYYKMEQSGSGSGITVLNSAVVSGAAINGTTGGTVTGVPSFVAYNSVIPSCAYTGITEYTSNFKEADIYPNPASEVLNVALKNKAVIEGVTLFDIGGRIVSENKFNSEAVAINTAQLENGIYFVNIYSEGKVFYERIVIAK